MKTRVASRWKIAIDTSPTIARLVHRHRVTSERFRAEVGRSGTARQGLIRRLAEELATLRTEIRKALSKRRLARGTLLPVGAAVASSGGRG